MLLWLAHGVLAGAQNMMMPTKDDFEATCERRLVSKCEQHSLTTAQQKAKM